MESGQRAVLLVAAFKARRFRVDHVPRSGLSNRFQVRRERKRTWCDYPMDGCDGEPKRRTNLRLDSIMATSSRIPDRTDGADRMVACAEHDIAARRSGRHRAAEGTSRKGLCARWTPRNIR